MQLPTKCSCNHLHFCFATFYIFILQQTDLKQLVDGDLVVDMAPYFEEYASDYLKSLIEAAGEACINACTYNGVQYGIPYVDRLLIFRELICSMIPEN